MFIPFPFKSCKEDGVLQAWTIEDGDLLSTYSLDIEVWY